MGIRQRRRTIDGSETAWLESGSGRPILMLHGLAGDGATTYTPVIEHLPHHHCFAPWARGHGRSEWADRYLIEDYATDAAAFIVDVIGEPVTIAGFSLGSMTAAHLAIHRPELVSSIFLEDSPLLVLHDRSRHEHQTYRTLFASIERARRAMLDHGHDREWFTEQVARFASTVPGSGVTFGEVLPDDALGWMASLMVDTDPAVCGPAQTLPTADLVAGLSPGDLSSIDCPVHLLAGQWDLGGAMTAEDVDRWRHLVPQVTTAVIGDVGHAIRFSPASLATYLDELDRFLARSG